MSLLVLLLFSIGTTIAQNLSNEATTGSFESEADKLESQAFQVSPVDIENNTSPFMRSDSGLNRVLALSNPPNLPIESGLNTGTLSIDNLANQLGVTVTEQNLLGNFNNLNTETIVQAHDVLQQQPNALDVNAVQSLDDYLNPHPLLTQPLNTYEINSSPYVLNTLPQNLNTDTLQSLLVDPLQSQNQYTVSKVYKSPPLTLLSDTNNNQLLNSVQTLLNQPSQSQVYTDVYQRPGTLVTDTSNDQLLNSVLLNQQAPAEYSISSLYQTPNQYQSLLTDANNDQSLDLGQLLSEQPADVRNQLGGLYQVDNTNQLLNLESLLGDQRLDLSNLQFPNNVLQTNHENYYNSISSLLQPDTTNLETRLVFKNQVPNLHIENCKAAFAALIQNAFVQYLKIAKLPYCQQSGNNPYPSSPLPFEIIVVPDNTAWQTNTNPALLKMLWQLLTRLKNQPVGPNQTDAMVPILLELILKRVTQPPIQLPFPNPSLPPNPFPNPSFPLNPFPNPTPPPSPFPNDQLTDITNPFPGPTPNPNLPNLLLLLKLLKNQPQNPSHAYLYKIIVDIVKKQSPNYEYPDNPYDQFPDVNPTPRPLPLPEFPEKPPVPVQYPDVPELSNPTAKYVILIFQKYLPQQNLSVKDLLYLIELVNTLPKSYNELLLNPQLLQQVILQLTNRNLNPQLVLAIIYKYLIQASNQNVLPPVNDANRVVVLKYQVQRQTPYIYKPYYYVLYKLPYSYFVKYLYQLLLAKPYLKQNRALLLKELLVLAMSNNNAVASDFKGVSKEHLVQLIINKGATPLDVKVVNENNVSYEQLKVLNDLSSQLGTESSLLTQTGGAESALLGVPSGSSGSNLWAYLLQQQPTLFNPGQVTNLNPADMTTVNPFSQILRRSDDASNSLQQDGLSEPQNVDQEDR